MLIFSWVRWGRDLNPFTKRRGTDLSPLPAAMYQSSEPGVRGAKGRTGGLCACARETS